MSSVYVGNLKVSVFGESHGAAIGVVIDGFPSGVTIDSDYIQRQLDRRKPNQQSYSTKRKESDSFKILSGVQNGISCGSPICMIVENSDARPKDYKSEVYRPSHADYTAHIRYGGFNAESGGGHFSGRLTACLVMAGAVCDLYLKQFGVKINAHIKSIYNVSDKAFNNVDENIDYQYLKTCDFPVIDGQSAILMLEIIKKAAEEGNSLGGTIECMAQGVQAGLGSPNMCGVENKISSLLFSVPAIKGVEFGFGFDITRLKGSQANDPICLDGDRVITTANHSGGIVGGITNGMPINFTAAIKPTPSIPMEQSTINKSGEAVKLKVSGRHDPCIVPRAVPVMESVMAIVLADLYLEAKGHEKS